jgi:predicted MFS family arabinose efflux permease
LIGGASGGGAVVGGVLALRLKPRRIVLASCLWAIPYGLPTLALGLLLPLPVIVVVAFVQGLALAMHLTLWFTAFQEQVPEAARSRVSAYDAMGSFVLIPLGSAFAGLVASAIGPRPTLIAAGVLALAANLLIFSRSSIYEIERRDVPQAA